MCEKRDQHEREFLHLLRLSQQLDELPTVRDPDYHVDAPAGRYHFGDAYFSFAWGAESLLLAMDSEFDYWTTLEVQAVGWTVVHISYAMVVADPLRILRSLALLLDCEAGTLGTLLDDEALEDQALLDDDLWDAVRDLQERCAALESEDQEYPIAPPRTAKRSAAPTLLGLQHSTPLLQVTEAAKRGS